MKEIFVSSRRREELIEITDEVRMLLSDKKNGICVIYSPHTTAGITINENADPDVQRDMLKGLASLNLEKCDYDHLEGNSVAHVKSSLVGFSSTVIVDEGRVMLGTWQGIYFCEFDGPRKRKVYLKYIGD